jgi:hypothetical protein
MAGGPLAPETRCVPEALRRGPHYGAVEQSFHPGLKMRQGVIDGRLISFQSGKEGDIGDIAEGIVLADIFSPLHFPIQRG